MAELVNQRIEETINELEQMRRTSLFNDEEIKEISRKRKEFEYRIQRHTKQKDDYVHYIAFELTLLEDIALRRKMIKLSEKRNEIEYAISKRLNKLFKQFIYRFQNDLEVYFEYIRFCKGVGFEHAVSGIIGKMLQVHGDKAKVWQMASRWEWQELDNHENARNFLLKGIHRHPESDVLYVDLFEIELILALKAEKDEKEKLLKRASIVWQNGLQNVNSVDYLFKLCDVSLKHDVKSITDAIKEEIWSKRDDIEVWNFIASKELEGCHWSQIEEFENQEGNYSKELNYVIGIYEEALQKFSDQNLCTKYIHTILGLGEIICTDLQKINAVKKAWLYGHESGLLTDDMYAFGIEVLKLEKEKTNEELIEIVNTACKCNPQSKYLWSEKLELSKTDEKKVLVILQEASKVLKAQDLLHIWNLALECVQSKETVKTIYKKFKSCESAVLMGIKPKLLKKMYEYTGLKAAREMYEDMIRMPPTQIEIHKIMIDLEFAQETVNMKNVRKCYECLVQHHGKESIQVWMDYMDFEVKNGSAQFVPALYRRAVATLKKELVDEFIKLQTLAKVQC